jgi:Region found in RelA / SpoT proteins
MAWETRQYPRSAIDEAGRKLISLDPSDPSRLEAIRIINNWRVCHRYPLSVVKMTLLDRAKTDVNSGVWVGQRIKRLPSIATKLKQSTSRLSQMQDIGGCRAVLGNVAEVDKLVKIYWERQARHAKKDRPYIKTSRDYITQPRKDGYRSFHFVMEYHGHTKDKGVFEGQRIEIQIRSNAQHAWATAVETCQAFTGQALKTKIKVAKTSWLRFFSLMSSCIAAREERPLVPDTPDTGQARRDELRKLEHELKVVALLKGWSKAIDYHKVMSSPDTNMILLELDTKEFTLQLREFKRWQKKDKAFAAYFEREKETESRPEIQVVLVPTEKVMDVHRGFPNFYVDTADFIAIVEEEIG